VTKEKAKKRVHTDTGKEALKLKRTPSYPPKKENPPNVGRAKTGKYKRKGAVIVQEKEKCNKQSSKLIN